MRRTSPFTLTWLIAFGGFSTREAFAHRDSVLLTVMWGLAGLGLILGGLWQVRAMARRPHEGAEST